MLAAAGINLSRLELPAAAAAEVAAEAATAAMRAAGDTAAPAADDAQPAAAGACSNDGPAAAASGGGSSSAEPGLAAGPDWSWPAALCMLLRLADYELVAGLLGSCKPPLLGRGGAIPPGILAAFRWVGGRGGANQLTMLLMGVLCVFVKCRRLSLVYLVRKQHHCAKGDTFAAATVSGLVVCPLQQLLSQVHPVVSGPILCCPPSVCGALYHHYNIL